MESALQYPIFPPIKEIPRIPNINQIKKTTIITFTIAENEFARALTTSLIPLLWLKNLKGLKVLNSLKILMKPRLLFGETQSIIEATTMKKSS